MPKRSSQHRRRQITTGHRARVFGSTSRRLRLEGMEGRLMLSTTAEVDFPPLNLTAAQFNFDSMAPTPGGEASIYNAAGNSGGFIETPYSSGPLSVPGIGTPLPSIPRVTEPHTNVSIPTMPRVNDSDILQPPTPAETELDSQEYGGSPLDSNLDTFTEVLIGGPQVGGFDLQPSVIPIWEKQLHGPSYDASFARLRQEAVLVDEGGLIQIESVLSSMASLAGPELNDAVTESPAERDSDDADKPLRLARTTKSGDGAISGELARAMAFELAGGEPSDSERAAQADQHNAKLSPDPNSRPMPREPLSSAAEMKRGEFGRISVAAALQGKIIAAQATSIIGLLGGFVAELPAGHLAFERTAERHLGFTTQRNTAVPYAAGLDSAHMEAFEELAVERVAARSALGMEFSLSGALNATPLLMILALERIAASNSRRANRDERCPTSLPLRRAK